MCNEFSDNQCCGAKDAEGHCDSEATAGLPCDEDFHRWQNASVTTAKGKVRVIRNRRHCVACDAKQTWSDLKMEFVDDD